MKSIKYVLWGYLVFLTGFWLMADQSDYSSLAGVFEWRNVLNQYTGVLGIGVMSLAMILSTRPAFLERRLGGLDKVYRLHKWLGITALVVSLGHWVIAKGPKWLIALGWLERRGRKPRPVFPDGSWQQLFSQQRSFAESVGEWAFYVAVLLMALALIKFFPYRRFFQTHRILAITYLALVFHAVILVKFDYWNGSLGFVLAALMLWGSIAAVMSLIRKRAGGKRVAGRCVGMWQQTESGILTVDVKLADGWPGHEAGQFAFVTFDAKEGAHPFTIASAWNDEGRLQFLIKALGDYTRILPQRLQVGDAILVEGPYGQFNFYSETERQIWIAGGIGITPFMARLEALAKAGDGKQIDLFYCTSSHDPKMVVDLTAAAEQAGVKLHVWWGRLDVEHLINAVPEWLLADVWFCGPAAMGRSFKAQLAAKGLVTEHFHQELFEMR